MPSELGSSKGRARPSKDPCAHSTPAYISGRIGRNFHPCKNIVLANCYISLNSLIGTSTENCQLRLPNVL